MEEAAKVNFTTAELSVTNAGGSACCCLRRQRTSWNAPSPVPTVARRRSVVIPERLTGRFFCRLRHLFETPFTCCARFCTLQETGLTQLSGLERISSCQPSDENTVNLFFCNNEPESDESPLRKLELGSVLHFVPSQLGLMHDHRHRVADGCEEKRRPTPAPSPRLIAARVCDLKSRGGARVAAKCSTNLGQQNDSQ